LTELTQEPRSSHTCSLRIFGISYHPEEWRTAILFRCTQDDCDALPHSLVIDGEWTQDDLVSQFPLGGTESAKPPERLGFAGLAAEWVLTGSRVRWTGRGNGDGRATEIDLHPDDPGKSAVTVAVDGDDSTAVFQAFNLTAIIEYPVEDLLRARVEISEE
jgi:hypothetical protein